MRETIKRLEDTMGIVNMFKITNSPFFSKPGTDLLFLIYID